MQRKFMRAVLLLSISLFWKPQLGLVQSWNPNHSIGTVTGKYNFSYNQAPDQLIEIYPAAIPNTGLTYQWESSLTPTTGFTPISGATQSGYSFAGALAETA